MYYYLYNTNQLNNTNISRYSVRRGDDQYPKVYIKGYKFYRSCK